MFMTMVMDHIYFFISLNVLLLSSYLLGELWIHKKGVYLFPRYFGYIIEAHSNQQSVTTFYPLNDTEYRVVQKFGRTIVMIILTIYLLANLLLFALQMIAMWPSLVANLGLICLWLYHYHRSFNE